MLLLGLVCHAGFRSSVFICNAGTLSDRERSEGTLKRPKALCARPKTSTFFAVNTIHLNFQPRSRPAMPTRFTLSLEDDPPRITELREDISARETVGGNTKGTELHFERSWKIHATRHPGVTFVDTIATTRSDHEVAGGSGH